jgi:UDP-N-acetyl-D-mannosaminuronate dehydrogenase
VLLLGTTYKKDVSDQRESPAIALAQRLQRLGAKLTYHDPYVPVWIVDGAAVARAENLELSVAEADLVVLVQNHSCYDAERLASLAKRFLDTRGATTSDNAHRL